MSENNDKGFNKSVINWYIPTYEKLPRKTYKQRLSISFLFTFYR